MVVNINHNHVNNRILREVLKKMDTLMAKFSDVQDKLTALDLSVDQLITKVSSGATEAQLDTLVTDIDATQKKVDNALATKQV